LGGILAGGIISGMSVGTAFSTFTTLAGNPVPFISSLATTIFKEQGIKAMRQFLSDALKRNKTLKRVLDFKILKNLKGNRIPQWVTEATIEQIVFNVSYQAYLLSGGASSYFVSKGINYAISSLFNSSNGGDTKVNSTLNSTISNVSNTPHITRKYLESKNRTKQDNVVTMIQTVNDTVEKNIEKETKIKGTEIKSTEIKDVSINNVKKFREKNKLQIKTKNNIEENKKLSTATKGALIVSALLFGDDILSTVKDIASISIVRQVAFTAISSSISNSLLQYLPIDKLKEYESLKAKIGTLSGDRNTILKYFFDLLYGKFYSDEDISKMSQYDILEALKRRNIAGNENDGISTLKQKLKDIQQKQKDITYEMILSSLLKNTVQTALIMGINEGLENVYSTSQKRVRFEEPKTPTREELSRTAEPKTPTRLEVEENIPKTPILKTNKYKPHQLKTPEYADMINDVIQSGLIKDLSQDEINAYKIVSADPNFKFENLNAEIGNFPLQYSHPREVNVMINSAKSAINKANIYLSSVPSFRFHPTLMDNLVSDVEGLKVLGISEQQIINYAKKLHIQQKISKRHVDTNAPDVIQLQQYTTEAKINNVEMKTREELKQETLKMMGIDSLEKHKDEYMRVQEKLENEQIQKSKDAMERAYQRLETRNAKKTITPQKLMTMTEDGQTLVYDPEKLAEKRNIKLDELKNLDYEMEPLLDTLSKIALEKSTSWLPGVGIYNDIRSTLETTRASVSLYNILLTVTKMTSAEDSTAGWLSSYLGTIDPSYIPSLTSVTELVKDIIPTSTINIKEEYLKSLARGIQHNWDLTDIHLDFAKSIAGRDKTDSISNIMGVFQQMSKE
jgi:hypothetical protein